MPARIQILSPQLANQIAAGEVVERPASVVKELVENSLDAGAKRIVIDIEQGGQKRILIRDDGVGIDKEQLKLALSRHATSKIETIDDLEALQSMGFRGEALASISSVSRLSLSSKPRKQSEAWRAQAEGRDMDVVVSPTAHPDGTSIEVLDLFFNTPARRKFLRSTKTEFQHLETVVKRLALVRHDVHFTLKHNSKTIGNYIVHEDASKRVEHIIGKSLFSSMVRVDYHYDDIHLKGWVSALGEGASTRDHQYMFVNGRMMKDKLLMHALRQAYEETLPPQSFAYFVLYLQLPSEQIDVNVHPAKHEVRFHESKKVHDLVFRAINEAIGQLDPRTEDTPNHDYILPLTSAIKNLGSDKHVNHEDLGDALAQPTSSPSYGGSSSSSKYATFVERPSRSAIEATHALYQPRVDTPSQSFRHDCIDDKTTNESFNYLVADTFVLVQSDSHLYILEQSSVVKTWMSHILCCSETQVPLLMPVGVKAMSDLCTQTLEGMKKLNILVEYRSHKYILKRVPNELTHLPWLTIFPNFISHLSSLSEDVSLDDNALVELLVAQWLNCIALDELELLPTLSNMFSDLSPTMQQKILEKSAKRLTSQDLAEWYSKRDKQE